MTLFRREHGTVPGWPVNGSDRSSVVVCTDEYRVAARVPTCAPKRIVFVTSDTSEGGVSKYVRTMAAGAAARGMAVEIVHIRRGRRVPTDCIYPSPPVTWPTAVRTILSLWRAGALRGAVVHMNCSWGAAVLPVLCLARCLSVPAVLTQHNIPAPLPPASTWWRAFAPWRLRSHARRLHQRLAWHLAQRLILLSESARTLTRTAGRSSRRACVIPNGVDTRRFAPDGAARARIRGELGEGDVCIVGSTGSLLDLKNYPLLIHALAALGTSRVALLLVGDGPEREHLEQLARRCGVERHVHLVGYKENVADYLNAMDVFVLPSLTEGLPFALLEAMAIGLPVVATNVGAVGEVVHEGRTGLIVAPGEAEAFTIALKTLIDSPGLREQLGTAARNAAQSLYSQERMVERTLEVYERMQ